jgi:hypothetical protein
MEVFWPQPLYDVRRTSREIQKFKMNMMNKKIGLIALLASVAAGELSAATLTNYAVGDVLICFRKGGNDLVVDAGPLSTFTNAAPNQRITISQYTGSQLAAVGTNGVSWSAFTWLSDSTLCVTKPRSSLNSQTTPWQAKGPASQAGTAARMATIPPGATDQYKLLVYPVSTQIAVAEEDSSDGNPNYTTGISYHDALARDLNFDGTFVGNPENTTDSHFTTNGVVVRSDFYKMTPTGGFALGTFLGYFELNTNGVMTYVAYPTAAVSIPVISSIARTNTTTTIYYTTGPSGIYTLRGTNNIGTGAAGTNWPAISTLSSGDSAPHSTSFTDTDDTKFYIITAQ